MPPSAVIWSRIWDRIDSSTAPPTAPSGASVDTLSRNASAATQVSWIAMYPTTRASRANVRAAGEGLADRRGQRSGAVEHRAQQPRGHRQDHHRGERQQAGDQDLLPEQPRPGEPASPAGSATTTTTPPTRWCRRRTATPPRSAGSWPRRTASTMAKLPALGLGQVDERGAGAAVVVAADRERDRENHRQQHHETEGALGCGGGAAAASAPPGPAACVRPRTPAARRCR